MLPPAILKTHKEGVLANARLLDTRHFTNAVTYLQDAPLYKTRLPNLCAAAHANAWRRAGSGPAILALSPSRAGVPFHP